MIEIAKILKPQGIKGEIKALPLTNVLAVFNSLTSCMVGKQRMEISSLTLRQGYLYIKFNEINSRTDAELYRNKMLMIEKERIEALKEDDEFLVEDLIGMIIYDDQDALVGQIVDIANYGACDIFMIENAGKVYEVPYVDDVFFVEGNVLKANHDKLKEVMI